MPFPKFDMLSERFPLREPAIEGGAHVLVKTGDGVDDDGPTLVVDRRHSLSEAADCGRREGANNMPPCDAVVSSATEQSYIGAATAAARRCHAEVVELLGGARRRVGTTEIKPINRELILAQTAARAAAVKVEHAENLVHARLAERKAKRDKEMFKDQNGLAREAVYSQAILSPLGWLAVLVLIETALNAWIFMTGSDQGLLGGAVIAVLCSLVNVGLGFGTGVFGLRHIGHVKKQLRTLGWIVSGVGVAAGLSLNAMIAVVRSQLEVQSNSDTGLTGVLISIGLGVAGIAIFVSSMAKGHGGRNCVFDPYVGYRAVDLTDRETAAGYEEAKDAFRRKISDVYDSADIELGTLDADNERKLVSHKDVEGEVELSISARRAAAQTAIDDTLERLRTFRASNMRVRNDDAPAYFAEEPVFDLPDLEHPGLIRFCGAVAESASRQAANQSVLVDLRLQLAERRIADIEGFLELIDRVESRADERLIQDALNGVKPIKPKEH